MPFSTARPITALVAFGVFTFASAACNSSPSPTPTTPPPTTTPPPSGTDDAGPTTTCPAPSGAGTKHTAVAGDETWTAATSPHVVEASLDIAEGKTLTIEPCAVVQIAASSGFLVKGKLLAIGTADRPILFEPSSGNDSGWSNIEARAGAEVRLAYVGLSGGGFSNGARPNEFALLDIRGNQEAPTQPILFVENVVVNGSRSLGVLLREGGGFAPGSTGLVVTGGLGFPALVWGRAVGTLPSGVYTGNATDEILIPALGGRDDIQEDTVLADPGVPYRVGLPEATGTLIVRRPTSGEAVPLLTINPGVTLRFQPKSRLILAKTTGDVATGALRAEGTVDNPVVFTSAAATPAAGDWTGVVFLGIPDPRTKIAHAKIAFAGGTSQISSFGCPSPGAASFANEGAIIFAGAPPSAGAVTNTTIEASAGEGIVRGWTGEPVDLLATNTFTGVARCNQTFPKPAETVCPEPAPCPK